MLEAPNLLRPKLQRSVVSNFIVGTVLALSIAPAGMAAPRLPNTIEEFRVSSSLYGSAGMLDMPNALMFDEGHYSFTGQLKAPDDRITLNIQPLPWFEGSFRYAIIDSYHSPGNDLFDRSFDFKVRLFNQRDYMPSIAVGVRDIAGTKVFGSEYVVGTYKTRNFNFTAGLGFGRMSTRAQITNPLTAIWDGAAERNLFEGHTAGKTNTGSYFRGENAGVFGGIEYMTPINGLKAIVEYSSDAYVREQRRGIPISDFPLNVGLSYKPNPSMEIGASLIQGDTFSIRLTIQTNAKTARRPKRKNSSRFLFKNRSDNFERLLPLAVQPEKDETVQSPSENSEIRKSDGNALTKQNKANNLDGVEGADEPRAEKDYLGPQHVWNPWQAKAGITLIPADTPRFHQVQSSNEALKAAGSLQSSGVKSDQVTASLMSEDDMEKVTKDLETAASYQGIGIRGVGFRGDIMYVRYINPNYSREPEAMGRLLAILSQVAPDHIEQFELILIARQLEVAQATFYRSELERVHKNQGSAAELFARANLGRDVPEPDYGKLYSFTDYRSDLNYGIRPFVEVSIFDPDDPMRYQLALDLHADYQATSSINLAVSYTQDLYNNFDEIRRGPSSVLPHVRTETANFLKNGASGVKYMTATHSSNPLKNVFMRTYGGLFESMYGGVGAEMLYRPYKSRWAAALEVDWVRQRDFDLMFKFREYETTTGYAKLYYQTPYHDIDLEINVGRYLAKDIGATFKIKKVFDNGTELGIFATFTDVSFEDYGEGSFDKGLILKFPFHLASPRDSKQRYSTVLRMITRDGGAQLDSGETLYERTSWQAYRWMVRHWPSLLGDTD
jgi:hypothetical protein